MSSQLLRLNAFRGEPASSGFEWHFTPNHNSSADSSTSVDSLSLRLRWFPLTKPLPMSRRLILQQARGQSPELSSSSHCLGAYGFMFYFTPRWGFFSPFPHGTTSLSVTQEYLALQGGPC
ncbi:hypothetical protein VNO78_35202 [Psophocarpus tetragonolobus]|uniref:Uncharacterized protein n=1 Tax=Psophocarpus tetragonolobus TaxID=3891 RepID=A0AAN9N7I8_PSOTE